MRNHATSSPGSTLQALNHRLLMLQLWIGNSEEQGVLTP